MTKNFNMRAMHKTMRKDFFIVSIGGSSDPKIRDGWVGSQCLNEFWWPISGYNDCIIVDLIEIMST